MSSQLPYRLEVENRRAIVALLPELNEVPWADIEKVGSEILAKIHPLTAPQLLVDLCALNYMGSAQVALVVRMFKTVKEKNGKMVVANRDPMVMEVLTLAGLNRVWTIVNSRERAMSMLGGGSSSSSGDAESGGANPVPGVLALVATLAAAVFVVIHFANPTLIPSRGDLFGCLGCAAAAFLAGLWTVVAGHRAIGVGALLLSMAALLFGVFELAKSTAEAPAPAKDATVSTPESNPKPHDDATAEKSGAVSPEMKPPDGAPPIPPPGPGAIPGAAAIRPPDSAVPGTAPPSEKNPETP